MAEIVLDVEHLNTSGDGVARHRGQIITVPFTIPGERVRVSLDRSRTRAANLLEVVRGRIACNPAARTLASAAAAPGSTSPIPNSSG